MLSLSLTIVQHPAQSQHAAEFLSNPKRNELYIELSRSYVPPFLHAIFDNLKSARLIYRKKILLIYTLACADFALDFGRIFPVSIFLMAHDILASSPTNSHPSIPFHKWMISPVTTGIPTTVNQYFGQHFQATTPHNWLMKETRTLFNTVCSRYHTMRPCFARTTTYPTHLPDDMANVNPYIYALSADPRNIQTLLQFTRGMSHVMQQHLPGNHDLQFYTKTKPSQSSLLNHYYSTPSLPTWYFSTPVPVAATNNIFEENNVSPITFANRIKFLHSPNITCNTKVLPNTDETRLPPWLYLSVSHDTTPATLATYRTPEHTEFEIDRDVTPPVRHFCPISPDPEEIRRNLSNGKLIESFEIDGFSIRQPDTDNPINVSNNTFLESAILISSLHHGTEILSTNRSDLFVHKRRRYPTDVHKVRLDFLDLGKNTLPIFGPQIYDADTPNLPGFDRDILITTPQHMSNSLSFVIENSDTSPNISAETKKLYAWSSYRYYNPHQLFICCDCSF